MKSLILGIVIISSLSACSSSSSTATLPISFTTEKRAENCEYLGTVNGTELMSFTVERNISGAKVNAANEVIKLGGNTGVLKDTDLANHGNVATVTVDAYKCN